MRPYLPPVQERRPNPPADHMDTFLLKIDSLATIFAINLVPPCVKPYFVLPDICSHLFGELVTTLCSFLRPIKLISNSCFPWRKSHVEQLTCMVVKRWQHYVSKRRKDYKNILIHSHMCMVLDAKSSRAIRYKHDSIR